MVTCTYRLRGIDHEWTWIGPKEWFAGFVAANKDRIVSWSIKS